MAAALCEYERERLRNIKKNQERLASLLGGAALPKASAAKQTRAAKPAAPKRKRSAPGEATQEWREVRRNPRRAGPEVNYDEREAAAGGTAEPPPPPSLVPAARFVDAAEWRKQHPDGKARTSAALASTAKTAAGVSTKELSADVPNLQARLLGRSIDTACCSDDVAPPLPPKAMATACVGAPDAMVASALGTNVHDHVPRFNKYSGVQEWANAVALFVNVVPKDGESVHAVLASSATTYGGYHNLFARRGARMRWYAPKGQDESHPVVRRLVNAAEGGDGETVLLFLRRETEHYVFAGRVACSAVLPDSRPLQLEWDLLVRAPLTPAALRLRLAPVGGLGALPAGAPCVPGLTASPPPPWSPPGLRRALRAWC